MTIMCGYEKSEILTFRVGSLEMGVALERVYTVEAWTMPTVLPRAPKSILGVIAVRGRIIPVACLRTLMGLDLNEKFPGRPQLVVVRLGSLEVAFKTDGTISLMSVDSAMKKSGKNQPPLPYIEDVMEQEGRVVHLIDLERLLLSTAGGLGT
jgi:purine-binding chemotaxis protein CheW